MHITKEMCLIQYTVMNKPRMSKTNIPILNSIEIKQIVPLVAVEGVFKQNLNLHVKMSFRALLPTLSLKLPENRH